MPQLPCLPQYYTFFVLYNQTKHQFQKSDNQLKLKQFIEDSARFYNCQFIISTHSPFLLNLLEAKIYNLDQTPVSIQKWSELPNMKLYYEFFKERKDEFENEN